MIAILLGHKEWYKLSGHKVPNGQKWFCGKEWPSSHRYDALPNLDQWKIRKHVIIVIMWSLHVAE